MRAGLMLLLLLPLSNSLRGVAKKHASAAQGDRPAYTSDGRLQFPARYREWVFLTSGVDMSYDPKPPSPDHTMFDNVFVNPSAYRAFLATGTWPEGTVLVVEERAGEGNHSINTHGRTQALAVMGMEIHVKDSVGSGKQFPGGWAFYNFSDRVSAKAIARPASCYTCHDEHAAVDTTFVQFYPTLMGVTEKKGTLSSAYLKQLPAAVK